ncbi:serine/threonine protein kinase [Kitasatospora purpeofusca]|uniref:serine/threonine-protein kinase n=1 Tax=Kitasatospora purpeofusca TaxID=67352 RepID=UPI0022574E10|nr:serine/threonine-protein kinase [Kitasatospora purpeofusca]MCX4687330.1 serine/threonine protein kinase [Kitasatospora purpeofusca]
MQALGADDPRQVGAYRLLRRLGAGGMGRVYLGRTAGGRTVAVKVVRGELAEDAEFRARFRQEVAAARRVGGTWTAPVLDADTEGTHPWVATGYVAGPALGGAVREYGPLTDPAVRTLGAVLAQALEHVHGLGLVHRDVKPSNVLLTLDGPRLIDFGIARALDAATGLTQSGFVVGSPGFMSPEQANGRPVGPPGDVFSLGAVLAYAASGVHPFGEGVSAAVLLYRVVHEEPDLTGLAPGPLRSIVLDCLAKDPAVRPTPRRLRELLDPDGSAVGRLGQGGGWLPPALAAAVGRSAVQLLDLEGLDPEGDASAGGVAVERTPTFVTGVGGGVSAGVSAGAEGASGSGTGSREVPPVPSALPRSGVADATPRRRRGVAALVAAAVLLVLAGGGYGGYRAWGPEEPGPTEPTVAASGATSATGGAAGGGTQAPPSPVPSAGSASPSGATGSPSPTGSSATTAPSGPNVVPEAFLGTWRGDMATQKGVPAGTTTLVIGRAAIGQEATTSRNELTGLLSITCEGAWTLTSAEPEKLVFTSRLVRSSLPGACTGGAYSETLTLQKDGTVRFGSADPNAGNPSGTLRRTG